jgi:hypothetical protein
MNTDKRSLKENHVIESNMKFYCYVHNIQLYQLLNQLHARISMKHFYLQSCYWNGESATHLLCTTQLLTINRGLVKLGKDACI